jgi:hypothetical protein
MGRGEYGQEPFAGADEGLPAGGGDLRGVDEIEGMLREIAEPREEAPKPPKRRRRSGRAKFAPTFEEWRAASESARVRSPAAEAPAPSPASEPAPPTPPPEPPRAERMAEALASALADEAPGEGGAAPFEPTFVAGGFEPAAAEEGLESAIPDEVPLAWDPAADALEAPGTEAEAGEGSGDPYEGAIELPEPSPSREVAIAEPMTTHDAAIVALGDNVRQVTNLIDSVARTLEAQNQRSMRLMERLEQVARALETLPEEADRNLEALDSVDEAIKSQRAPLESMCSSLSRLPEMLDEMRESERRTRDLFSSTTRAMAGRMAVSAYERRRAEERAASGRRWRTLAASACAALAFCLGVLASGTEPGMQVRYAVGSAIMGEGNVAHAEERGEAPWRVTGIQAAAGAEEAPLLGDDDLSAAEAGMPDGEWFGVDEEPGC